VSEGKKGVVTVSPLITASPTGIALPLSVLQDSHIACKFEKQVRPPLEKGTMWSRVNWSRSRQPHLTQQ